MRSMLLRAAFQAPRRWNSTATAPLSHGLTVSEFTIPLGDGDCIAGKLWKGIEEPSTGKRADPILCLHGWMDNACSFDPLLPLILKPNMTAVAIDIPGHGLSSHFKSCTNYDPLDASVTVLRVIKHFGFDKTVLLGHSMGSYISFIFAGAFPEFVSGYIALEALRPIPTDPIEALRIATRTVFDVEEKLAKYPTPPSYSFQDALERFYVGRGATITRDGCKTLLQRGTVRRPDGTHSFCHDIRLAIPRVASQMTVEQSDIVAAAIQCKVCVIRGDPGFDFEPREEFLKVVDRIRENSAEKVEFHQVPGTHHFHLNTPEIVAPIINNFLFSN